MPTLAEQAAASGVEVVQRLLDENGAGANKVVVIVAAEGQPSHEDPSATATYGVETQAELLAILIHICDYLAGAVGKRIMVVNAG